MPATMIETQRFLVNFIADTNRKRLGLYGKGSLTIQAGRLQLDARRLTHYLAWWGAQQSLELPLAAVCDVESAQLTLCFTLNQPDAAWHGRNQQILLPDADTLRQLKLALPDTVLPSTPDQRAQEQAFQAALMRNTPTARVSLIIISLCLLAFAYVWLLGGQFWNAPAELLLRLGGGYAPLSLHGEAWRLLSASFLHAGAFHLAVNLYALLQVAPLVERLYGSLRFALLYASCALAGSLASALYYPNSISVGASGAVLGLYGALMAYALRFPRSLPPGYAREFMLTGLIFSSLTLLQAINQAQIDHAAHGAGLLSGLLMGGLLAKRLIAPTTSRLT